jgi:hypothetical protein
MTTGIVTSKIMEMAIPRTGLDKVHTMITVTKDMDMAKGTEVTSTDTTGCGIVGSPGEHQGNFLSQARTQSTSLDKSVLQSNSTSARKRSMF